MKPALFTPAAESDVEEAYSWYEAQRPGLGDAFRRALDVAVASIDDQPESYAVLHRNTRRVLLPSRTACTIESSTRASSWSRVCMGSATRGLGALDEEG